ncbi:hypothetical protein ACH0AH_00290 [Microbacterium paludicola]|uniref:Fe-S oxidoreductase n=1 Tax=Microbacterium paludicola TaxID=300019 RepID=A0A4Y9FYZ8_9MICO|nr:hypothetical protein [Microbacterium paludicola]MBF0814965.1 hypothetical protein [Microbacterium paludicola]TFU34746.1 hypothetical protein E4U02_00890 [Microbacterium paludicola]
MQLGTRWTAGSQPPASVPAELRETIAKVEEHLPEGPKPGWTLTWLEGRPIAELDTGVTVSLAPDGEAVVGHIDGMDDDER